MASYALAGVIGALAGFAGGADAARLRRQRSRMLNFYGFVPVALGGMGTNRGAVVGGLALGLFQQAANFLVGGIFAAVAVFTVFIIVLLARARGPRAAQRVPRTRADGTHGRPPLHRPRRRARLGKLVHGRALVDRCSWSALALPLLDVRLLGRDRRPAPASTGCWRRA